MIGIGQDLQFGFRALTRNPAVSLAAVASLALGIAGNSLLFSVANSVLLKPLPYDNPDRLAQVFITSGGAGAFPLDVDHFKAWRDQNQTLDGLAALDYGTSYHYLAPAGAERLPGVRASVNFFELLGVRAQFGRTFLPSEGLPGKDSVAVLSHELWQSRFGSDPSIVGRAIRLNGVLHTVVGVLPATFRFPMRTSARLWTPLAVDADRAGGRHLAAIARLREGVSLRSAESDLDVIANRLAEQVSTRSERPREGARLGELREEIVGRVRPVVLSLFSAVAFILLITCANLSNLLLARAIERRDEMAIRAALGANRWRLMRQLLVESLLLSAMAGALAVLLTVWGLDALKSLGPAGLPRLNEVCLDGRVLAFTAAVSIGVGIVFGLAPLARFSGAIMVRNIARAPGASKGARRTRNVLVTAQVASSTVLLVGAGLTARSLAGMIAMNPGFSPGGVLTFAVSLPESSYRNAVAVDAYYRELRRKLMAIPGVEVVGATNFNAPLDVGTGSLNVTPENPTGGAHELELANFRQITPDYFSALRIPLLSGRGFLDVDNAGPNPIAVVNRTFAQRYWPGADAAGKSFRISGGQRIVIVGVVDDVREEGLHREVRPAVYFPCSGVADRTVLVRMAHESLAAAPTIRDVARSVDAAVPIYEVKTMDQILDRWAASRRFPVIVLLWFSGVALALTAVGLFGLMSHVTSSRTAEIGLRMALGADSRDVFRTVTREAMGIVSTGLVIGFAVAALAMRGMKAYLFHLTPTDPATLFAVAGIFVMVGGIAIYGPVRRATRIEPARALRQE